MPACLGARRLDPVDDTAWYQEPAGPLPGLVIRPGDRLSGDEARWLRHGTGAGESGLALDDVATILACGTIAIAGQERGVLLALAERVKSGSGAVPRALRSCPGA